MMRLKPFLVGAVGYVAVTFPVAYLWHLVVFRSVYDRLGYFSRAEPIVALGFLAIVMQGLLLSYLYPLFRRRGGRVAEGLRFGLLMGALLGTSQIVAAVAKHPVTSLSLWFTIEPAYFLIQFIVVGLVIAWAHGPRDVPVRGAPDRDGLETAADGMEASHGV